jgi:hypothetical protein
VASHEPSCDDASVSSPAIPVPPAPGQAFFLLRNALYQLGLPAEQQRQRLAGMLVTDELALDLDHALTSVEAAMDEAGQRLDAEVIAAVTTLMSLISAPPGDPIWDEKSLDIDSRWIRARVESAALLSRIPSHRLA